MTFYCITSGLPVVATNPNLALLRQACEQRGIVFKELAVPADAYAFADVPELSDDGALYCLSVNPRTFQYAYALHARNPRLRTWRRDNDFNVHEVSWASALVADATKTGIPTLYGATPKVTSELLQKIDTHLGGFPIIIKKSGGSHGTGVIFVESPKSLKTIWSHIVADNPHHFVIRKFIPDATHYRVVVVDDKVVSVVKYLAQQGDIRTNAVRTPQVEAADIPPAWRELAIAATKAEGVCFGGVDILVDTSGTPHITEVNTPCNFSRSQHCTGEDIAGAIVDTLCTKAK